MSGRIQAAIVCVLVLAVAAVAWAGETTFSADVASAETTSSAAVLTSPLRDPPMLTSSFGEYRSNHFHAGVDLSTDGEVGHPIQAPLAGEVVRVRASGAGYGRAIYLRCHDGRQLVFGHLDRFDTPIAEYIQAIQDSSGNYEQDIVVPAGRLPIARGQRIAWAGKSGVGAPHLHFEVRQGDTNLNPLGQGLAILSEGPPRIRAVLLEPMDPEARVDGAAASLAIPFRPQGVDTVCAWGLIRVAVDAWEPSRAGDGKIGPYAAGYDWNGEPQVQAAFDSISWDDAPEVEIQYDFAAARRGEAEWLRLWKAEGTHAAIARVVSKQAEPHGGLRLEPEDTERIVELRVWVKDRRGQATAMRVPIRIPPREPVIALDSLVLSQGSHPSARLYLRRAPADTRRLDALVRLEASRTVRVRRRRTRAVLVAVGAPTCVERETLAGGTQVREVWSYPLAHAATRVRTRSRVRVESDLLTRSASARRSPVMEVEGLGGGLMRVTLSGVDDRRGAPQGELENGATRSFSFGSQDGREWTALLRFPMEPAAPVLSVRGVDSRGPWVIARKLALAPIVPPGAKITDPEGRFEWELPADGAYAPLLASFESGDTRAPRGLTAVGPFFAVMPPWLPLRRAPQLWLRLPAGGGTQGVGLYCWDGGTWRYLSGEFDSNGRRWGSLRRVGRYALMRDAIPPQVRLRRPRRLGLSSYSWMLRARVADAGSGFDARDVYFEVDGRRVPTEYDPEEGEMRWRPPRPPVAGHYRYAAVARDRAGNQSRAEGRFVIR